MLDIQQIWDGSPPLSAGFSFTGAPITTSRVSTNVLDLLVARDLGAEALIGIHVGVTQTFVGGTSLQIDFEGCATSGGTYIPTLYTPVYPTAQLIAGMALMRYALPLNQLLNATAGVLAPPFRFIRLNYTVVGTYTAGAVYAYMTPMMDRNIFQAPPANYTAYATPGEV